MKWTAAILALLATAAVGETAEPVRLTTDGHLKQRPAWSPDGKSLVFARHLGATIFLHVLSVGDGTGSGQVERRLTTRTDPEYDAVWSPDGKRLAFAFDRTAPNQGDIDVYTIAADGQDLQPVVTSGGKLSHEEWPAWSPDGQWLALSSTRDGNQELYVARPDGKDLRRLTSDPAIDAHPAWSPDGKRIVFATNRWGDLELAAVDADGGNLVRLTTSRGLDDYPVWSPDGKRIAFTSNRAGNLEIFAINPDGSRPDNLTKHPAIDNFPAWHPSGRLTFVSNRDGGFEIYQAGE